MLNKILTALLLSASSLLLVLYLRLGTLESQIETKDVIIETAKASLKTAKQVNLENQSTIKNLSEHIKSERKAVEYIRKYNATVDASVTKAVSELKGLLQDDENSCGQQRLPDAVIDSMQQHYRLPSSNADS